MKIFLSVLFILLFAKYSSQHYVKFEEELQKNAITYLTFCKQGGLLEGSREKVKHPKFSIVIPMYNEAKHFLLCLRTIQNQSIRELEIICVDDNSNDNTQEFLAKLQEEDPRIKIIRNRKNRGVLYNRMYGALKAKGEYIAFADADDAYLNMNIFKLLYEAAQKMDFPEAIHFHASGSKYDGKLKWEDLYLFFVYNPNTFNQVFYQPEIRDNYMQGQKSMTGSGLVFDKIYSKKLVKRMADFIGPDLWNQHLVYIDDFLVAFACMRVAKSFVTVNEIGYWHWFDNNSSMTTSVWGIEGDNLKNPKKSNKKILDYILVKERMLDTTDDDPNAEQFRADALRDLEKDEYVNAIVRSIHFDRLMAVYERILTWKYCSHSKRIEVIKGMKKFLDKSIPIKRKYAKYLKEINEDDS